LEQTWRQLGDMRLGHPGRFFVLSLSATEVATGRAIHQFAQPVSLTLSVGDLVPAGQTFELEWYDEENHAWRPASGTLTPDPLTGEVQVALSHFTDYGGRDPSKEGWKLLFTDAQYSAFSGGISYAFPIDVPAGIRGLQPGLALSYSSGGVNGQASFVQSDWAGLGWTLDSPQITRVMGYGPAIGGQDLGVGENAGCANNCAHQYDLCMNDNLS
jgi:hypothetical protein